MARRNASSGTSAQPSLDRQQSGPPLRAHGQPSTHITAQLHRNRRCTSHRSMAQSLSWQCAPFTRLWRQALLLRIMLRIRCRPCGAAGRSQLGKMLSRQRSVPAEERLRLQAEVATAQAATEEARFDLARKLAEVRSAPTLHVLLTKWQSYRTKQILPHSEPSLSVFGDTNRIPRSNGSQPCLLSEETPVSANAVTNAEQCQ